MRKLAFISCFLLILVGMSSGAQALVVTGTGAWNTWGVGDLNENGNPFWDGASWDGPQKNIGYWVSQTGAFVPPFTPQGPGVIPYYGNSTTDFSFTNHGSVTAGLLLEIAGYANSNTFGWYNTSDPSTLYQIFSGPDSPFLVKVFIPSSSFGFYLAGPGGTFYTQASLSPDDTGNQHFAVFSNYSIDGSQTYWLGMEDLRYFGGDKDFNDMVIKIGPVPEPASLLLLGTGLIGLAVLRRKYKA